MAARKKAARKKAPQKAVAAKATTATSSAKRKTPTELLAKRLVRITNDLAHEDLAEIYAEDCVSIESGHGPEVIARGLHEIEEKHASWQSRVEQAHWTARNVFAKRNTICIEWQAELKLSDGRVVNLDEVAIHEVKGGKITSERFLYDPALLFDPIPEAPVSPVPVVSEPVPELEREPEPVHAEGPVQEPDIEFEDENPTLDIEPPPDAIEELDDIACDAEPKTAVLPGFTGFDDDEEEPDDPIDPMDL